MDRTGDGDGDGDEAGDGNGGGHKDCRGVGDGGGTGSGASNGGKGGGVGGRTGGPEGQAQKPHRMAGVRNSASSQASSARNVTADWGSPLSSSSNLVPLCAKRIAPLSSVRCATSQSA